MLVSARGVKTYSLYSGIGVPKVVRATDSCSKYFEVTNLAF